VYLQHKIPPNFDLFESFRWWSKDALAGFRQLILRDSGFMRDVRDQLDILSLQSDPADIYAHSLIPAGQFSF
jgi:hypothetical protein